METEDCSCGTVPSLMLNSDILSSTLSTCLPKKIYYIGDEEFYELPENSLHDRYVEFELRVWKRSNIEENFYVGQLSDDEKFVWTPDGSTDDDDSENGDGFMDIYVKERPNGVIINSNVYLTMYQWHTIIQGDVIMYCFICDDYMSRITLDSHIKSSDHKQALNSCKPLVKYELSITRELRNKYHCGTCNVLVEKIDESDHYQSELHEDNLLSAINKVSDFTDDYIEKESDENVDNDDDSYDNDSDYDNEWVKAVAENPGTSYANRLKKTFDAPQYYDVDVGDKRVRVTFDCWHMLIKPKDNSFYCMVCKEYYRITMKNQHCVDAEHLDKLKQCPIVERFGEYFVRQIDDLYHCGRCNSLQLKGDIENHLEYRHNRKPRKVSETVALPETSAGTSANKTNHINNVANAKPDIGPSTSKQSELEGPDLYKDVIVNYYDLRIFLPFFNYNVILRNIIPGGLDYCCGLCNFVCNQRSLPSHTQSVQHLNRLQQSPFILPFSLNMIRYINGAFHCAICNTFIMQNLIYVHIQDPYHLEMMNKIVNNTNSVNIASAHNTNINFKPTDIDKTNPDSVSDNKELDTKNESISKKDEHEKVNANNEVDSEENLDTSVDSSESVVDLDSCVYVKVNAVYFKITFTSYNTLVPIGDGSRYCFVCNTKVLSEGVKRHVESRSHVKNMTDCYFLDIFEGELFRQMYTTFHCGVCNAPMPRSKIKEHLTFTPHMIRMEASKQPKRVRKNEVKDGVPMYAAKIGKEILYEHAEEPVTKIIRYIEIVSEVKIIEIKYKMIMINDNILKLPISSWHGLVKLKQGYRCVVCQKEMEDEEAHVKTQEHDMRVHNPFVKEHLSDLLREVNNNILHCVICNTEIIKMSNVILKHIEGKKHKKKYALIKEFSKNTDSYTDCDSDMLQL